MSITRLALRFAAPLPELLGFQRYLFIGPHPDDIRSEEHTSELQSR